ncbi:phosphate acetyltransferase [Halalkalibacterium halodurans]|uniref:phosphate acetyltransferase n=1 Tax=Halalkalibacterium halodurans TaxID=86665 RepID=UPI002AAA2A35|nr:phosphate acetyltransferase [Halalkalibacterium halodurans]MDY7224327.1 phosphate acetyltransferase [Halalkalibacterium halodurans]MDY7243612.1 phosphate acetyltransferase [Halalkalibacterium halodurans]
MNKPRRNRKVSDLFRNIQEQVKRHQPTIVLPEGTDERILEAAANLAKDEVVKPILVGNVADIQARASELNIDLGSVEIIDPKSYGAFDDMVHAFVERRKGKETEETAREKLVDVNYFGTMLVYTGVADGLVSGAAHSTGDTVRPALQIIKTQPGIKRTSGVFIMVKEDQKLVFADCAINIAPTAEDLAEIAVATAETAKVFDIDPKVAMLSFSTKGSAVSPETEKVAEATKLAQEARPDLVIDGEFQFDAAFVPAVAQKKAPESPLKGEANVFVFPSLESGNIGYKIAQRLGGYEAIGPILQGLNQPVNDLSRGCNASDVYKLSLITALQAINQKGDNN